MIFGFRIKKRRLSNLLLEPLLQTKIGLYCIGLSILFAVVIALILYNNLGTLFDVFFDLTDGSIKLHAVVLSYLENIQAWLFLSAIAYIVLTIGVSIIYTHRLVGPTIAFRRHLDAIKTGDFKHRTLLRKGDAFLEVADRLNEVSELLETKTF